MDRAAAADRKAATKQRQTGDGRGKGAAVKAWRRAEQIWEAWLVAEQAWGEVRAALQLFTPEGALNTRAAAAAALAAAGPRLAGRLWAKVRRGLQRPQLLTFLDQAAEQLAQVQQRWAPAAQNLAPTAEGVTPWPEAGALLAAAVRVEGLRQQPQALRGAGPSAAALRGILLAASLVLTRSGEAGRKAAQGVREALRGVWRASSLVECLNSVARMQQGRHRKMTQGLLDLKRLYWNCRAFRTGHRRKKSPYELQGLPLPTREWWALLRLTPEQLRQHLQRASPTMPAPPPQKVSGQEVAA